MIGLFGGTFDPIHLGHLRTALDVQQALGLSEVRLIPGADPPHRPAPDVSAAERAHMVSLAIEGKPFFSLDTRELEREGPSYTVLTLESFRRELGESTPLCWIVGTDAFLGLPTWHRWQDIMRLCNLAVMVRPGYKLELDRFPQDWLERHLVTPDAFNIARAAGQVVSVEVTQLDISATRIRALRASLQPVDFLVAEPVLAYIGRKSFYEA